MKEFITLDILDQKFTFQSDLDPKRGQLVVDYLQNNIDAVQTEQREKPLNLNRLALMIVVALNLAFENIELKQAHSKDCQTLAHRMENIVQMMNAHHDAGQQQARCG